MSKVKELLILSMMTVILFVSEQALTFLPNVQVTVLLIILYTRIFGVKKTLLIVIVHTLADNLIHGSLMPMTFFPMLLGWTLIPVLLGTVFKFLQKAMHLAIFSFVYSYVYGFLFIPFTIYFTGANFMTTLILDIPFSTILGISSFLSILWLYEPLYGFINGLLVEQKEQEGFGS